MELTTSSLKQLGCLPVKEAQPFNLLNTPGAAVPPLGEVLAVASPL